MDELTKSVNDPAGAESALNAGLAAPSPEYLAFKEAGCETVADKRRWDAACAWQREQDCKIIDSIDDGDAPEYRACQEAIRAAANAEITGSALLRSPR